ncbi:Protein of unknown function [Gryllus bimaculatus]|nr:Protein of unknown function [Gryllus bimaculatus]
MLKMDDDDDEDDHDDELDGEDGSLSPGAGGSRARAPWLRTGTAADREYLRCLDAALECRPRARSTHAHAHAHEAWRRRARVRGRRARGAPRGLRPSRRPSVRWSWRRGVRPHRGVRAGCARSWSLDSFPGKAFVSQELAMLVLFLDHSGRPENSRLASDSVWYERR